ncbi:MAG: hypothetical protein KJN99_08990 [Marinicaulis sp.]|nr:hypothetical protein [Marinicaulis sp.]
MKLISTLSFLMALTINQLASASVIAAGEHGDFSRIVVANGGDNIRVEKRGSKLILHQIEQNTAYELSDITEHQKAKRVSGAALVKKAAGDRIELSLNCDCKFKAVVLSDGKFVLDIFDQIASPLNNSNGANNKSDAQERPKDQFSEADLISADQAHDRLMALLEQAAQDGIVEFKSNNSPREGSRASNATLSIPNTAPIESAENNEIAAIEDELSDAATGSPELNAMLDQTLGSQAKEYSRTAKCFDDLAFFIDGTGLDEQPIAKIAEIKSEVAENDGGQGANNKTLAEAFLAIGFGEEALALLMDSEWENSILAEIAMIVAERKLPKASYILNGRKCSGAHAFWKALAVEDEKEAASLIERSNNEIDSIPKQLRALLAPRLSLKMIDAEEWEKARYFYDVASATIEDLTPELEYIATRLLERENETQSPHTALFEIAVGNSRVADDALLTLAEKITRSNEEPYEGFIQDIGALAKTSEATAAILAEAVAWANMGDTEAALHILRGLAGNAPKDMSTAQKTANDILIKTMDYGTDVQKTNAIDVYLKNDDWIFGDNKNVALLEKLSQAAIDLGVPEVALSILGELTNKPTEESKKLLAKAAYAAFDYENAIKFAAPYLTEPSFVEIVYASKIQRRKYHEALATAALIEDNVQKITAAAQSAWLARAWESATDHFGQLNPIALNSDTAFRYALAAYMAQEDVLPPVTNAVLREKSSVLSTGVESLFAQATESNALERSRSVVKRTADEIAMVSEALNDG